MAEQMREDYGALVGWSSQFSGGRVTLRLQCVNKPPPHRPEDIHSHFYTMDRNQAVQLGNYLFEMVGATVPDRKGRSWLARMFG